MIRKRNPFSVRSVCRIRTALLLRSAKNLSLRYGDEAGFARSK
jgi:hypothetical protein